ncbi:MAG: formylglycine-generating enzyme family protein [Puniceicoccales bacterium]|nr:formylglycine-generating enzyme family protein [Puniceicoccales bacterium]
MPSQRISIIGTAGAGKTVFIAALDFACSFKAENVYPRIIAQDMKTRLYTAKIMDDLEDGKWPSSTAQSVKHELTWVWQDKNEDNHTIRLSDCAGQDFRDIFEATDESELSEAQRALKTEFFKSNIILLLINLQPAFDIYKKPGTGLARMDIEVAPARAIRDFQKKGITVYAVFTQSDRYAGRVQREWNDSYENALKAILPQLYHTLVETGTQFAVVHSVETEEQIGKDGTTTFVPKKKIHKANLSQIVAAVTATLEQVKQKEREKKEAEERARREREAAERRRNEIAEATRLAKIAEVKRRERNRIIMRIVIFVLILLCIFLAWKIVGEDIRNVITEESRRREQQRLEIEAARAEILRDLTQAKEPKSFVLDASGAVKMDVLPVPAGNFQMGSDTGAYDEKPVHRVEITKAFYLGKTEVTQAQWKAVMGNNSSNFNVDINGDNLPVRNVSWNDAVEFCKKLTDQKHTDGTLPLEWRFALPTEAQWEYACRAGTTGDYAGTGNLDDMGWYNGNSANTTHPVAQRQPNSWGFYDMHGNGWEWCADLYADDYYARSPATDPSGPRSGGERVARGGSWTTSAATCRSAYRVGCGATIRFNVLGFRVVCVRNGT